MKKLIGAAVVAAAAISVGAVASGAGQTKTDVCHSHGDGTFDLINVADPAIDSHIGHGDGLIGDAVPGQAGFVFDEACQAIPAQQEDPFLRALAWQDLNENGSYDEGVDNLIAKLRDEGGVYTVTTGFVNDFLDVYPATVTTHVGTAAAQLVDGYRVDDQVNGTRFLFQANETVERYLERTLQAGFDLTTQLRDFMEPGAFDDVTLGSLSPSLWALDGEDGEITQQGQGNDPFIEVSIFFP